MSDFSLNFVDADSVNDRPGGYNQNDMNSNYNDGKIFHKMRSNGSIDKLLKPVRLKETRKKHRFEIDLTKIRQGEVAIENSPASHQSSNNDAITKGLSRIGNSRELRSNFLLKPRMPPKNFVIGTSDASRSRSKKHQRNETNI